jgi:hypothetical protein
MQRTIQRFQDTNLTQEQIGRLYEYFATEAQHYRQQYHQYIAPDAYKAVLAEIKAMLERMKARSA